MPTLKGYFVDILVLNDKGDKPYKVERIFFTADQRKEYLNFISDPSKLIRDHGKRYS